MVTIVVTIVATIVVTIAAINVVTGEGIVVVQVGLIIHIVGLQGIHHTAGAMIIHHNAHPMVGGLGGRGLGPFLIPLIAPTGDMLGDLGERCRLACFYLRIGEDKFVNYLYYDYRFVRTQCVYW